MKTLAEFFKELLGVLILLEICKLALNILFGNTLLGKLFLMHNRHSINYISHRWYVWKRRINYTKHFCKWIYKQLKKLTIYGYDKCKQKHNAKIKNTPNKKKVINGNNIIDFKTATKLRHKWNK